MAVWFVSFSTWTGRHGLWLEDLFVAPAQRGLGIGKALLTRLAAICTERGWTRLEWVVLDWNSPAIEFYRSLGATPLDEWTTYRVSGDALHDLTDVSRAIRPCHGACAERMLTNSTPETGAAMPALRKRRVGPVDTMWLNMDRPNNLMVIEALILLDGVPDWDEVIDLFRRQVLEQFPVFRQRPDSTH